MSKSNDRGIVAPTNCRVDPESSILSTNRRRIYYFLALFGCVLGSFGFFFVCAFLGRLVSFFICVGFAGGFFAFFGLMFFPTRILLTMVNSFRPNTMTHRSSFCLTRGQFFGAFGGGVNMDRTAACRIRLAFVNNKEFLNRTCRRTGRILEATNKKIAEWMKLICSNVMKRKQAGRAII
jgi:hypothetical protein